MFIKTFLMNLLSFLKNESGCGGGQELTNDKAILGSNIIFLENHANLKG